MTDDLQLLDAWRSGDATAGEALLARHYESVIRFFRTKAGDDADDLAQRTFLACVEAATRFRGGATFTAFLFGIARNILLEYIRSRMKDKRVDPDFGVSSILDVHPRASTVVFQRAERRRLVEALQRMPLEIQMTLELFYWEGLSIDEVAEVVGQASGTVKSRLHRGREMLRDALEGMSADSAKAVTDDLVGARPSEPGPA